MPAQPHDSKARKLIFIHDAAIDDFVATLPIENMATVDPVGVMIANTDCAPEPGMEVGSRVNHFIGRPHLPLGLTRDCGIMTCAA